MAEALAAGSRPGEVAKEFGMCSARISQKRREFYDSWRAFHGEGEPLVVNWDELEAQRVGVLPEHRRRELAVT